MLENKTTQPFSKTCEIAKKYDCNTFVQFFIHVQLSRLSVCPYSSPLQNLRGFFVHVSGKIGAAAVFARQQTRVRPRSVRVACLWNPSRNRVQKQHLDKLYQESTCYPKILFGANAFLARRWEQRLRKDDPPCCSAKLLIRAAPPPHPFHLRDETESFLPPPPKTLLSATKSRRLSEKSLQP